MRLAVVGSKGMLGQDLIEAARQRGHTVAGLDRPEIDITNLQSCLRVPLNVDAIINCAAYTDVDACESHEPTAFDVNAVGPANLAWRAKREQCRLVQISTDYVFPGDQPCPIAEDTPLSPISAYGRTKAAGEWAVLAQSPDNLVVRTAWLYGAHGRCFPKTIVGILRERGTVDVVADQHGQPTWTVDLSNYLLNLLEIDAPGGVHHGTASGSTTWYEFALAVAQSAGLEPNSVRPTLSTPGVRPARRPAYSTLAHSRSEGVGADPIGPWNERWRTAATDVLGGC